MRRARGGEEKEEEQQQPSKQHSGPSPLPHILFIRRISLGVGGADSLARSVASASRIRSSILTQHQHTCPASLISHRTPLASIKQACRTVLPAPLTQAPAQARAHHRPACPSPPPSPPSRARTPPPPRRARPRRRASRSTSRRCSSRPRFLPSHERGGARPLRRGRGMHQLLLQVPAAVQAEAGPGPGPGPDSQARAKSGTCRRRPARACRSMPRAAAPMMCAMKMGTRRSRRLRPIMPPRVMLTTTNTSSSSSYSSTRTTARAPQRRRIARCAARGTPVR